TSANGWPEKPWIRFGLLTITRPQRASSAATLMTSKSPITRYRNERDRSIHDDKSLGPRRPLAIRRIRSAFDGGGKCNAAETFGVAHNIAWRDPRLGCDCPKPAA